MAFHKKILIGLFFTVLNFSLHAQDDLELKVKNHLIKYCTTSQQESKLQTFVMILKKMPPATFVDAEKVIDIVLPQICFFDYPNWLIDRAFNLAVYGIHEGGLKPATVKKMTEFMRSISLGREDYIIYGKILENMLNSGIEKEYINNFIHAAIDENYGTAGVEALAVYYITKAAENGNHDESLKFALNETKLFKSQYDRFFVLNKLYGEKDETTRKNIKASDQEKIKAEYELKNLEFWKKYQNKVHLIEKLSLKKTTYKNDEIVKTLTEKLKTPYGYRINKSYGIDGIGLVSLITNSSVESLPYTLNSYCTLETVAFIPSLKTGDIVLFSDSASDREISALGVILENREFVYVTVSNGATKADLNDSYFKDRFVKGCRIFH